MLVAFVLATKDSADGGHRYDDFKKTFLKYTLNADSSFESREQLAIGGLTIDSISTPGHTPGSACYVIEESIIFTGDSLIQDTPTITRLPESNKDVFMNVTMPFLKSLDKGMLVFPGHGEPFKINEAKYL